MRSAAHRVTDQDPVARHRLVPPERRGPAWLTPRAIALAAALLAMVVGGIMLVGSA